MVLPQRSNADQVLVTVPPEQSVGTPDSVGAKNVPLLPQVPDQVTVGTGAAVKSAKQV